MTSTFKSYVDVQDLEAIQHNQSDFTLEARLSPNILPGEVVIAHAQRVLKYTALGEQRQGITGSLFVTNFKLSFVTADTSYKLVDRSQQNYLLGPNDVCLINIDSVYQASKLGVKKKKMEPGTNVSGHVKTLQVVCRDFRVFTFSFKFSSPGEDKTVTNAILHHAFPIKPQLLFAYEYRDRRMPDFYWKTRMFNVKDDWEDELNRCHCHSWRVSDMNTKFSSKSYPSYIVVPSALTDSELTSAASNFPDYRLPVWSWGNLEGSVILRASGAPLINNSYGHQIYEYIKAMKKAHPYGRDPRIMNLDELLPNFREIQANFVKLKDLCTPDSLQNFLEQDSRFQGTLDSSNWLQTVSTCLNIANQVAIKISANKVSVVLRETNGRDLSCLVSSLAQIILDKHYRTIVGFQSLIQKEWVAFGHKFLDRLGRLKSDDQQESPIFLLFLDCTWQMVQQFPASFEYTETYLTTVWDSAHISIFDTFLFNCELDRRRATADHHNRVEPRSVWDWRAQFSRAQTSLFLNPLYTFAEDVVRSLLSQHEGPTGAEASPELPPRHYATNARQQPAAATPRHYQQHQQPRSPSSVEDRPLHTPGHSTTNFRYPTSATAATTTTTNNNHHQNPPLSAANPSPRLYRSATLWSLRVLVNNLPDVKDHLTSFLTRWRIHHILPVQIDVPLLRLWRLCYFRWMPPVQIGGGGPPTEYMEQCRMIREIKSLQRQIASYVHGGASGPGGAASLSASQASLAASSLELGMSSVNLRSAVELDSEVITSAYPFSAGGAPWVPGISLSYFRQSSYIPSDDDELDGD